MVERGVYLAPSPSEAYFWGTAHGEAEQDRTVTAQREALEIALDPDAPAPAGTASAPVDAQDEPDL